jgi:hybrid cluster-associated redox disulfide protein
MSENKVTKDMSIIDIVQKYPQSIEVFARNGLGCIGCAAARFENLEAGAKVHGIDPDKLVNEINEVIS